MKLRARAKEAGGRWYPKKRLWFVEYGRMPIRPWKSIYM
jgi:hypothetical protein